MLRTQYAYQQQDSGSSSFLQPLFMFFFSFIDMDLQSEI